ncbi:hypothetical protein PYCCODRAFT_1481808 [Trametes coccinea BRFM310]|uniref:Protein kinase domain-containing protein n=1 Tax=Trametes coccinea (strain BRFM310) TaxID=1353009 RepID=A0A1Y2I6D6_TRAC3|nr:hypothetical protein PYCCODRAFT_1481808 [Trametes coccinea BRFM310]
MRFIGARTSLPQIPVVVDNFMLEGKTWLVMSRLPGHCLADVYPEITPEIEQRLSSQLSHILAPLRAIPPPGPARAHSRPHEIRLTHNDLSAHNILVDDDWNITGIVDWEACAWMPEYWELTKGTFLLQYRKGRWNRIMTSVFPGYASELEAERYIVKYRRRYT